MDQIEYLSLLLQNNCEDKEDYPTPIEQSIVPEFDYFAKFSKVYTIKLLSELETRTLSLALKGASDNVTNRFFHLMESRQADEVCLDMEQLFNVQIKDIEEAQRYMLAKIKNKGVKKDCGDA